MSSKLLSRLHEDSVLELLLVMAQHTSRVNDRCCPVTFFTVGYAKDI